MTWKLRSRVLQTLPSEPPRRPGWYTDADKRSEQRWWNGYNWTVHVRVSDAAQPG